MPLAPEQGKPRSAIYGQALTLGLQLGVTVVVFYFLGRWLDSTLGTTPWLMYCGLALGVTGGMISFVRTALSMGKAEDREAEERRKESRRER